MKKLLNSSGQKSYQRQDHIDRSFDYRQWLRTVETQGSWCDIDFIKTKRINGEVTIVAVTELTRCDDEQVPSEKYFDAIGKRWYLRDGQAEIIEAVSAAMVVPAYLVVFGYKLNWFRIWDFQEWKWLQPMSPQQYKSWLSNL